MLVFDTQPRRNIFYLRGRRSCLRHTDLTEDGHVDCGWTHHFCF